ncbi:hypothetical protein PHLCEN_2v4641 [Hermanssonia centrifuga]|uniref:Uncharacterized protein n=1 Tax=Hermanssonia centrifuga TaxID=98765 RepID=A0A2R6PMW3_9APHY|nr:hypothetical protein PHLCEN_2v4641 [Hermanssonia centrifuga]
MVHLQAYHWSSFGSTNGISLELPAFPLDSLAITSLVKRGNTHLVGLDIASRTLKSVAFDITHKATEFTFKADKKATSMGDTKPTAHNSLIDCHHDVWTRFPVVPAVQRHTVKSSARQPRVLLFVSHQEPHLYERHFAELIVAFESTRKPVDQVLSSISVSGQTYRAFLKYSRMSVSCFKAGEWLVDILCLIPIHLAVARDNRFIPLKDGVWSPQLERSLLGATVDQVTESLTFGWYESIFQSYMASRVGSIAHFINDGYSKAQFQYSQSELCRRWVLFRNNFALSRDITGLFQSFQSSSTVLDPAANPSLFKSTLVIIIKDVVDSDKAEITKEFSLKFQRIVEVEQASNFITRLHEGKLAIIPWPVIESRQFYALFPKLKKILDKQALTHPQAGIFLQTMKTLMAKLKTNDWGSLDQNLASHRAQQLLKMLPSALAFGATELEPEYEPLKDFDNGTVIDAFDTGVKFFISAPDGADQARKQDECLVSLQTFWDKYKTRFEEVDVQWVKGLEGHLNELAQYRVGHVQKWLDINRSRFQANITEFEVVLRSFETLSVNLKSGLQLCKMQCAECQLFCLHSRHHDGPHNCRTSHMCPHNCHYTDEHMDTEESCGLPAGHTGAHMYVVICNTDSIA